ncbi:MAG: hypothetical protein ABI945_08865 [Nitrospirales bacterium]
MRHGLKLLTGVTLGAGLLYLLDAKHGARRRASLMEGGWPLPARIAAGAIGSAVAWHGTNRKIMPGIPLTLMGFGLLGRALANCGLVSWMERDADGRSSVQGPTVKRTISISAPIDHVFNFWAHYDETFPHCIARVKQITAMGLGRARWVLDSLGAADMIWNTVVTRCDPNKELAWETERGSAAQHSGRVKFINSGQGTTTIHVQITYNALAQALARSMAGSLGMETKTLLEEDLNRIKSTIESGVIPHGSSHRPAEASEAAS